MTDYANDASNLNMEYINTAGTCIKHAVNIQHGLCDGNSREFVNAARDALEQITDVPAPINSIISICMFETADYINESIQIIKAIL